jgi:hypothetical protein
MSSSNVGPPTEDQRKRDTGCEHADCLDPNLVLADLPWFPLPIQRLGSIQSFWIFIFSDTPSYRPRPCGGNPVLIHPAPRQKLKGTCRENLPNDFSSAWPHVPTVPPCVSSRLPWLPSSLGRIAPRVSLSQGFACRLWNPSRPLLGG